MKTDLITNRKAYRDFQILETIEAGIALTGTEVKSLRQGRGNLNDGYVRIDKNQAFIHHFNIQPYEQGNRANHEPLAARRLLLHKREIRKLFGTVSIKGRTIVPLKMYWKRHHLKLLLGVGVGKNKRDRRDDLKERAMKKEVEQAFKTAKQNTH